MKVRDAATMLVLRESPTQVFMVKRHSKSAFLANAWVYPGGALDPSDFDPQLQERVDISGEEASEILKISDPNHALAFFLAAIRETFEEAGLLLATRDGQHVEHLGVEFQEYRSGMQRADHSLLTLAKAFDLEFPVSKMRYLDHWITPEYAPRRFDTRFFVVEAPKHDAVHDELETVDGVWISPEEALRRGRSGEWFIAPPTESTLEKLLGTSEPSPKREPSSTIAE